MKRLFRILEGTVIGFLGSGWMVIMGDVISSSWIGITITMVLSIVVGGLVNRFSGVCAGVVAGGSVVILGNMVSQSTFGMVTTLLGGAFIGGLVAWDLSHPRNPERASSGQFAR